MTQWDIQPSGVKGVLQRTEHVATAFEGQVRSLNTAVEGAGKEATSGIIAKALSGFMHAEAPSMKFCFTRTADALQGAVNATQAYIDGDLKMAANAQQSTTSAHVPTNMPGTGPNGTAPR